MTEKPELKRLRNFSSQSVKMSAKGQQRIILQSVCFNSCFYTKLCIVVHDFGAPTPDSFIVSVFIHTDCCCVILQCSCMDSWWLREGVHSGGQHQDALTHSLTHTHTQMGTHMKYIGTRSVQGKLAKTSALWSKNEYDTTQSCALAGGACRGWKGSMAKTN